MFGNSAFLNHDKKKSMDLVHQLPQIEFELLGFFKENVMLLS